MGTAACLTWHRPTWCPRDAVSHEAATAAKPVPTTHPQELHWAPLHACHGIVPHGAQGMLSATTLPLQQTLSPPLTPSSCTGHGCMLDMASSHMVPGGCCQS